MLSIYKSATGHDLKVFKPFARLNIHKYFFLIVLSHCGMSY